jgi:diguanylate cyclase (GGDEF)-like protein
MSALGEPARPSGSVVGGSVVHERHLAVILSDFARTLGTDFPIQAILDHLIESIVDVLPVTGAGVSLISNTLAPRYVAASDENALRYERLQTELREGPCLSAYTTGEAVSVPDLMMDGRFPRFGPAAKRAGLAAVFTFPLRHGDGRLGALDLYRQAAGGLDDEDMAAAQTLADVTAAYLSIAQDRELARSSSERFRHIGLHDALTGLPNRVLLQERIGHAAKRAHRSRTYAAILFVDLDRFKRVNDARGHDVGDRLLVAVAKRLSTLVRPGDTLARYAGDEFVFLCEDLHSENDVDLLARRVDQSFDTPFIAGEEAVTISASVGVAFAGPGQDVTDDLVTEADRAMYQAKRRGGASHQIIDLRESTHAQDQDDLEDDLKVAFRKDELCIFYQPVVRTRDGVLIGVEALLRWTHADRGPVSPTSVISLAEKTELIHEMGSWVLERACLDHLRWQRLAPTHRLDLAVNVSSIQLMRASFPDTVSKILGRSGFDPRALILEITESILIEDPDRAMLVLAEMKSRGVRFALDDFGTGYSSLSYLRRLPIDVVKIDRSFIADLENATTGRSIVAAVTDLAQGLGLSVTAEGVETQSQRDDVDSVGCDSAQGFFYGAPMSATAIARLLEDPDSWVHQIDRLAKSESQT